MIREFRLGDEKQIAAIEKECFSLPWSENAVIESYKNNTRYFLYEENGNILGYAGIQTVLDEGYITNVAVIKNARGKGIGTALILALTDLAKKEKFKFISLEVRESNSSAIALYLKCGFKNMGKRKNFYSAPSEDAVIMTTEDFR